MNKIPIHKAVLERNPACCAFDVFVISSKTTAEVTVLQPLSVPVWMHHPVGTYVPRTPAFQLDEQSAQAMLDGLWEAGVRPSSGQGKATANESGVVAAMKEHLADLRKIAFAQMATEITSADTPLNVIPQF